MSEHNKQHEAARIVLAAAAGEASSEELQRLHTMLTQDAELASFVVDLMSQESWLAWHSPKSNQGDIRDDLLQQIALSAAADPPHAVRRPATPPGASAGPSMFWTSWAVSAALLLGVLIGAAAMHWRGGPSHENAPPLAAGGSGDADAGYAVRYVGGTACLWNPSIASSFDAGREVQAGESLNLLQGIAELDFELPHGSAVLKIEGPAGLVITQSQNASLNQGVFTVETTPSADRFHLQTPSGLVELNGGTSAGVRITGGDVELHVFRGAAQVKVPWATSPGDSKIIGVAGGAALSLVSETDGRVRINRGVAVESSFTTQMPMLAVALRLPDEYEQAVLRAEPLLYWRFEEGESDRVLDHSGNGLHGQVVGVVERVRSGSNASLSLGAGFTGQAISSHVRSDQPVSDRLADGYSIELWFKPSHYHWGSLVSVLDCRRGSPTYAGHGVSLELGGARLDSHEIERPAKVRFLHRDPPSANVAVGASCFSESPYALRRWQHVAAVKDGQSMRLYVDGELASSGTDSSHLAPGLSVLLGQLDERQYYRRFIGHIDEVAIYPRPLTGQEIAEHVAMAKSHAKASADPLAPKSDADSPRNPGRI